MAEIAPRDAYNWNDWGTSLAALGRCDDAIGKFRRATEIANRDPSLWDNWADCYVDLGRQEEVLAEFARHPSDGRPNYPATHSWGRILVAYLDADPDARCDRAARLAPASLKAAAPFGPVLFSMSFLLGFLAILSGSRTLRL